MSTQLKTPGVYIKEISKFPPSVAQVETAIPAFIGYTDKAKRKAANDLKNVPTRITSILEYEALFGGANKERIVLEDTDKGLALIKPSVTYLMYYSLQMFFANGGGPCYIVSVGDYATAPVLGNDTAGLKAGLNTLEKEDEPTLIVFPDAVSITDENNFYGLYSDALAHANKMQDRFVIMDTYKGNSVDETNVGSGNATTIENFREKVASDKYGAVYFPHLTTILNYVFEEESTVTLEKIDHKGLQDDPGATFYAGEASSLTTVKSGVGIAIGAITDIADPEEEDLKKIKKLLGEAIVIIEKVNETADSLIDYTLILADYNDIESATDLTSNTLEANLSTAIASINAAKDIVGAGNGKTLADLEFSDSALYHEIKKLMQAIPVVLPSSSAMAGVYAKVDSGRGVWKSPANLGLNYVIAPTEKVSHDQHEGLNVHTTGKSINAIRNFTGKGNLVWGARTLDGNSNEWRYISVRRFFNMVEESVKKATENFVFEANDAKTWGRIKGMVENFLNLQWKEGALAGAKPKDAYYVNIGLGETMSAQDVLEGRLIVEIGMAAVRPAEFIVLKFSHKLQES